MIIGMMGYWHTAPVYKASLAKHRLMPSSSLTGVITIFGVLLNPRQVIMVAVLSVPLGDHHH